MPDSPEKTSLKTLTLTVVKTSTALKKLLQSEASPQRDKKILRLLTELDVHNDQAMRDGLELSPRQIAQMRTGRSGSRSQTPNTSSAPRVQSPFSQLMEHHAKQFVDRKVFNAPAQGKAIKEILAIVTPEVAIQRYNLQLEESWRQGRVSWLTVRPEIGRMQTNGVRPMDTGDRNADKLARNLFVEDLRSDTEADYH